MPVVLLDRLPLPSLQAYTVISVLLLSCSVYYAVQVTSDPQWKSNITTSETEKSIIRKVDDVGLSQNTYLTGLPSNSSVGIRFQPSEVVTFMIQEPLCIWTLINMAYCGLILLGKFIQRLVFGELRVSEQQHIKDKFWNFVFYKFIFVFGVVNVQQLGEVVLWCSWFSVLGFLHLLAQLCRDRFEYLSFSPTTPKWSHIRLLTLLAAILAVSGFLFLICVFVGFFAGLNTFAFMAAECVLLIVRTLYVIVKYGLHLYDLKHAGGVWERRGQFVYHTELVFELMALFIDLVHHLHMLLWGNIFLSMASLVICMQLRYLVHEIRRRLKRHSNYRWITTHMEKHYPMATPEELVENTSNCAICWERLESARKLPCSHLFHNSCLQSWLEQDTSCPTCRMGLGNGQEMSIGGDLHRDGNNDQSPDARPHNSPFFHFDGSRYVSWLPSFSVEVTHTQLLRADRPHSAQTSQLDAMGRQVQQLFPHMPLSTLVEDLRGTRSMELTIDNILDGRLVPPPPMFLRDSELEEPEASMEESRNMNSEPQEANHYVRVLEPVSSLGSRFSKSPSEREQILRLRKEQLLSEARRRYLARLSEHQ